MTVAQTCNAAGISACGVAWGGVQVEPLRKALPASARVLLVTATMPEPTWLQVQAAMPEIQTCTGPRLHQSAPGVREQVLDCSGGDDISEETGFVRKAERLVQIMAQTGAPRTIIFCNKIDTARKVSPICLLFPPVAIMWGSCTRCRHLPGQGVCDWPSCSSVVLHDISACAECMQSSQGAIIALQGVASFCSHASARSLLRVRSMVVTHRQPCHDNQARASMACPTLQCAWWPAVSHHALHH